MAIQRQLLEVPAAQPAKFVKLTPKERGELMREILQFANDRGLISKFDATNRRMVIGVDYATR